MLHANAKKNALDTRRNTAVDSAEKE